jgi:hypothetical protein
MKAKKVKHTVKVGQTVVVDTVTALRTSRCADGVFRGAGGIVFPHPDVIYTPARVFSLGEQTRRALVVWGPEGTNLGIWIDESALAPVAR